MQRHLFRFRQNWRRAVGLGACVVAVIGTHGNAAALTDLSTVPIEQWAPRLHDKVDVALTPENSVAVTRADYQQVVNAFSAVVKESNNIASAVQFRFADGQTRTITKTNLTSIMSAFASTWPVNVFENNSRTPLQISDDGGIRFRNPVFDSWFGRIIAVNVDGGFGGRWNPARGFCRAMGMSRVLTYDTFRSEPNHENVRVSKWGVETGFYDRRATVFSSITCAP